METKLFSVTIYTVVGKSFFTMEGLSSQEVTKKAILNLSKEVKLRDILKVDTKEL